MAENKASSPDFVKKLFQMLGEHEYDHIVRWAPQGDSFLVLDTNEFTKVILPRHFKHSNFASFVRQLNKYDFHKVRQADQALEGNPHGEGTWEFKHPEFNVHNGDALDNIKRKAPAAKRIPKSDGQAQQIQDSPVMNGPNYYGADLQSMQRQFDSMKSMQNGMNNHLQALTRNYQQVISEMLNFQRNMVAQDQVMQNLISYFMSHANGGVNSNMQGLVSDEHAQKLVEEYSEVARQSYEQVEGMTRRASHLGLLPDQQHHHPHQHPQQHHHQPSSWPQYDPPAQSYPQFPQPYESNQGPVPSQQNYNPYTQMNQPGPHQAQSPGNYSPSSDSHTPGGSSRYQPSQVYQQQQQQQQQHHQQQQQQQQHNNSVEQRRRSEESQRQLQQQQQQHQHQQQQQHLQQQQQHHHQQQQQHQRLQTPKEERTDPLQHRQEKGERFSGAMAPSSTFEFNEQAASMIRAVKSGKKKITPWVSPPKILLVEDDAVCRRLSSKFLSFFGCDIDTATDGVSAVNQMNQKKYDLVLMDIVMPNLDGVSATSLIRQFDPLTPIISMTSNVESGDVMTYFSHGMNDILPKPFTKDGLLGMLEKHLMHLKTLKQAGLNGQDRKLLAPEELSDGQDGENGVTADADYLGMLSGLLGAPGQQPVASGRPNSRRSKDDTGSIGEQDQNDLHNSMGVPLAKRAKLEDK